MIDTTTRDQAEFIYQTLTALKLHLVKRLKHGPDAACCALTLPQSNALMTVRHHETMSIRQISEALSVAPSSASTMVDRLVDLGMLCRETSPDDRRTVQVQVTPRGEEQLAEMEAVMLGVFSELLERLGPTMARQWVDIYGHIRSWMDEEDDRMKSDLDGPMETTGNG